MVCIQLTEPKCIQSVPHYTLYSPINLYIQKQESITKLSPRIFSQWFPDTPLLRYSTRKRMNVDGLERSDRKQVTKNLFLNGWTKDGQVKFNNLMVKIHDDRVNYSVAFYKRFMKFCKHMEEKAPSKKAPRKRKHEECVLIYSDNNIPPMDMRNMTEDVMNQIKATNKEMENWECEALGVNFILYMVPLCQLQSIAC